jgi:hypothetical protein
MKRVLEVVAITLLVVGTELATGAVSFGIEQVLRVYHQVVSGTEPEVSLLRFFVGVGMVTFGAFLVAVDLWARAYSGYVGRGKFCPHCNLKTDRVKRRTRHKVLGLIVGEMVVHRKCKKCGWHGLTGLR